MPINFIPLALAFILTLVHYYSERVANQIEKYHSKVLSFSSGLFIALIFLFLLPEVIKGITEVNVYFLLLLGFLVFHLAEKFIYQHIKDKKHMLKDLAELHMIGFFADHFIVGLVLVLTFSFSSNLSFLIFIPFLLHTVASSMSLEHLHEKSKSKLNKLILGASTFVGALVATLLSFDRSLFFIIYSLALGAIFYVSIRDMIPSDKEGNSFYFLIGTLIVIIFITLLS